MDLEMLHNQLAHHLPLKSYLGENATVGLSQSLESDGQIPSQGT